MRVLSVNVYAWENGTIQISLDTGDSVNIKMNEEESERFRVLASDVFFSRQKSIAKEIETARPQLIELKPDPIKETPSLDDDIPY